MTYKISKTDQEWQQLLSPEEFTVCRSKGTEQPFSGIYNTEKSEGVYHCRCCNEALFDSHSKYDSGSGWPSFYQSLNESTVDEITDGTLGMSRTEILCHHCGSHLGHVFPDGPQPTGQRYCVNSLSLKFTKK